MAAKTQFKTQSSPRKKIKLNEDFDYSLVENETEISDICLMTENEAGDDEDWTPSGEEESLEEEEDINNDVNELNVGSTTMHTTVKSHNKATPIKLNTPAKKNKLNTSNVRSSSTNSGLNTYERVPDLLIPATIDAFGECLKTKLGSYRYGHTLVDPPSRFFQGVVKGAAGQTLAAMFGDVHLIEKLDKIPKDEIGHFVMDTTYKVIPTSTTGLNHVFTINLLLYQQIIPLWFAVTTCSSAELYKRILIEFRQHVLDWPFHSVLLNNDLPLCKGVLSVFPDICFYGSWFYYCYSVWNELKVHNLVETCKTNSTMMTAVKMLLVIPYLPSTYDHSRFTMVDGFENVKKFAAENDLPEEFNQVLEYVDKFWFTTVGTSNFTLFGKHTKAINYAEVFQLTLLSYTKPKRDVWSLIRSFQLAAKSAHLEVNRYFSGKPFQKKRFNSKKFNVAIRENSKKLTSKNFDVRTFLDKSSVYCDDMMDIFLHPLYATTSYDNSNYTYIADWKLRIE